MKHIIEEFTPLRGKHCITNSLKQIFMYHGYPMSEDMIFGLASGLSFLYLNQANSPMVNGRTKVFEFEQKLASRLHITIQCKSTSDTKKAMDIAKGLIDQRKPILIYADMPYLPYLGMDKNAHFGGHAVVLLGYDDEKQIWYISDRDNHDYPIRVPSGEIAEDYHLVEHRDLVLARGSTHRPFPAHNKYLIFDFEGYRPVDKVVLQEAIQEVCSGMLKPPAQLLGVNGILKFSKEVLKWKAFSPQKLRLAGTTNYFQINQDGGTGGGIFRNMYGRFLIEVAIILENEQVAELGEQFLEVSELWDDIAADMWNLSLKGDVELLSKIAEKVCTIYEIEKNLYKALQQVII